MFAKGLKRSEILRSGIGHRYSYALHMVVE